MTNLVQEVNPITNAQKAHMFSATDKVDWTEPGLTITRLRLLSEPGHPAWDVSYCYGEIAGESVQVQLPFSSLPKRNMKKALYAEATLTGKFIKGLFTAISSLN